MKLYLKERRPDIGCIEEVSEGKSESVESDNEEDWIELAMKLRTNNNKSN